LTAWVLAALALQWGNTLHLNGRWESSKVDLDYGILGAVSFLTTRTALHRGHLDLGVWHGYQELVYEAPVVLEQLDLRFRLVRPGYVVVLYEVSERGFRGVRLSRDEDLPSLCVAGDADGAFTSKAPLSGNGLADRWYDLRIVASDAAYRVELDGVPIGTCGEPSGEPARFGVRGSAAKKTYIDDIRVVSAIAPTSIEEDFSNHRGEREARLAALLGVVAVYLVVLVAGARRRRAEGVSPHVALTAVHGVLLLCTGLAWAVEALYLGRMHPDDVDFEGFENRIEYETAVTKRLAAEHPREPAPPGVRRILAVGSSQTWGSGAPSKAQTWVAQLEEGLNEQAAPGERFEVINTGIAGLDASRLLTIHMQDWLVWQPEAVLIDLGNNDRDPGKLAEALEVFADLHEERGIHTVFVPEPNTIENRKSLHELEAKHEAMREVAARHGIPLIEVHGPLVERRDQGFVWWDRVHLTAFGHRLFAETVLAEREKIIRR
jgi:lysophospholipase L1-like esterase